jgi:hypothetical protein
LEWRAGVVWRAPDAERFGGFSGLSLSPDGTQLLALSDRVRLLRAQVQRRADGALNGLLLQGGNGLLTRTNAALTPFNSDPESLARVWPQTAQSPLFIGFEGLTRVISYHQPLESTADLTATRLHAWNHFEERFGNTGFEALAPLPGGGVLAIAEAPKPDVDLGPGAPAFAYRNGAWLHAFDMPDSQGFAVSGADLGPEGHLWVLERYLGWTGFVTRIRRFELLENAGTLTLGPSETLLQGRLGVRDNYEGISLWCSPAGRIIITLIADDGFSIWQRNAVAEFRLALEGRKPCTPAP